MSFNQRRFLEEHIPYRLGNLYLFSHALRVILSEPQPRNVRVIFDIEHEVRGPFWIITNPWVETGILTCRLLIEFLEAKPSKYKDDVLITMFQDPNGRSLDAVPCEAIAQFHPADVSESKTLEALKFTNRAADKGVAHLTLDGPRKEEEIQLYQAACIAIRAAVGYHLYENLSLSPPLSIISDFKRSELK